MDENEKEERVALSMSAREHGFGPLEPEEDRTGRIARLAGLPTSYAGEAFQGVAAKKVIETELLHEKAARIARERWNARANVLASKDPLPPSSPEDLLRYALIDCACVVRTGTSLDQVRCDISEIVEKAIGSLGPTSSAGMKPDDDLTRLVAPGGHVAPSTEVGLMVLFDKLRPSPGRLDRIVLETTIGEDVTVSPGPRGDVFTVKDLRAAVKVLEANALPTTKCPTCGVDCYLIDPSGTADEKTVECYDCQQKRRGAMEAKAKSAYTFRAHPVKVIDGETVWLDVDLGFHNIARMRFKLDGIDTSNCAGTAKRELEALIENDADDLEIETKKDVDGGYTVVIFVEAARSRINVNELLLSRGFAAPKRHR